MKEAGKGRWRVGVGKREEEEEEEDQPLSFLELPGLFSDSGHQPCSVLEGNVPPKSECSLLCTAFTFRI